MNKSESIKIRIGCELLDKAKRDSDVLGIGLSEHIRILLEGHGCDAPVDDSHDSSVQYCDLGKFEIILDFVP